MLCTLSIFQWNNCYYSDCCLSAAAQPLKNRYFLFNSRRPAILINSYLLRCHLDYLIWWAQCFWSLSTTPVPHLPPSWISRHPGIAIADPLPLCPPCLAPLRWLRLPLPPLRISWRATQIRRISPRLILLPPPLPSSSLWPLYPTFSWVLSCLAVRFSSLLIFLRALFLFPSVWFLYIYPYNFTHFILAVLIWLWRFTTFRMGLLISMSFIFVIVTKR